MEKRIEKLSASEKPKEARKLEARFKQKVVPGDRLDLSCEIVKVKGPMGVGEVTATVNGKLACKAEISFMVA